MKTAAMSAAGRPRNAGTDFAPTVRSPQQRSIHSILTAHARNAYELFLLKVMSYG